MGEKRRRKEGGRGEDEDDTPKKMSHIYLEMWGVCVAFHQWRAYSSRRWGGEPTYIPPARRGGTKLLISIDLKYLASLRL